MHTFLANNQIELIERRKANTVQLPHRAAAVNQLKTGVQIFLEQLERTIEAEQQGHESVSFGIPGGPTSNSQAMSEIELSAMAHGKLLLDLHYSIDRVVHDYGDLCQAITDLAVERKALLGCPKLLDHYTH